MFETTGADAGPNPEVLLVPESSPIHQTCGDALVGPFEDAMPAPRDVLVEPDHQQVRLRWDGPLSRPREEFAPSIEGYRVCWGPSESDLRYGVLVTRRVVDLLGVPNGETFVAVVQAVDQLGRLSTPVTAAISASPVRLDQLRASMTGFFDDFNQGTGVLDERRWNVAYSRCNDVTTSHIFAERGAAVMVTGNDSRLPGSRPGICDHTQSVARPRAVFDFSGREGRINFEVDGTNGQRSSWALDLFPYTSEEDLTDVGGHVNGFPSDGFPGPGLRVLVGTDRIRIYQFDANGSPANVEEIDLRSPFPDLRGRPGGILRRMEYRVSRTSATLLIDGQAVLANTAIDLDFERAFVHLVQAGFDPAKNSRQWNRVRVDNFGFDGPSEPFIVHNYKSAFNQRDAIDLNEAETRGQLTFQVPDSISGALSARYFFTIQTVNHRFDSADRVIFNGETFSLPPPPSSPGPEVGDVLHPFSASLPIELSLLRSGTNTVEISAMQRSLHNHHLEIRFPRGAGPNYSPPASYLAGSGLPALDSLGPSSTINNAREGFCEALPARVVCLDVAERRDSPRAVTPVSGTFEFLAIVSNERPLAMLARNLGAARIEVWVDGVLQQTVQTNQRVPTPGIGLNQPGPGGMLLSIDTNTLSNGEHELLLRTFDGAGTPGRPAYGFENPVQGGLVPGVEVPVRFTVAN